MRPALRQNPLLSPLIIATMPTMNAAITVRVWSMLDSAGELEAVRAAAVVAAWGPAAEHAEVVVSAVDPAAAVLVESEPVAGAPAAEPAALALPEAHVPVV